jgi:putative transcriptional regulator
MTRLTRWMVAFGAPLLASLVLARAAPTPETPLLGGSLRGQLLVASPEMGDPRFRETVILLVRHDPSGAFGLIINRPINERPLAEVLEEMGRGEPGLEGTIRVFFGGPVELGVGFVLHSAEYRRPETLEIDGRVALTATPEVLRDLGHGKGPKQSLFAVGYAGWGAGQLEGELERHDWITAAGDLKLIFEEDREHLWEIATARRTRDL